jgi:hypothetical protein
MEIVNYYFDKCSICNRFLIDHTKKQLIAHIKSYKSMIFSKYKRKK